MILTPAAALLASGLVMPEPPRIHIPSPAIVRAQNIELSRHMLRAMPLTMGLLIPRRQQGIAFVGLATATKAGATSGNTTLSLSSGLTGGTRSAVQAGDLVIAAYSSSSTVDRTLAITDGTTAYTLIGSELYANDTYDINLRVAYKFMGSTPDTATTFGPTGATSDAGATAVYVFSGVNATTPLDVAATTATALNSGLPNPPSITPVTAGAYIMCVGATLASGSAPAGSQAAR